MGKHRKTHFVDDAILVCQGCGLPFAVRHWEAPRSRPNGEFATPQYCCRHCQSAAARELLTCAFCGKVEWLTGSLHGKCGRHYCSYDHFKKGLAKFHVGPAHHNFKGGDGRAINRDGYATLRWSSLPESDRRLVYGSKSGRVFEHRVIMARVMGRPIRPDERVHHLNGVRDDNRLENLQLEVNNGSHTRLHAAVYAELRALRHENELLKAQVVTA